MAKVGEVIEGRFLLTSLLGTGGMGDVYEATDKSLNRTVALKFLQPSQDLTFHARFLQEANALAHCDHPNIVKIHSIGKWQDSMYLCMELVSGQPLNVFLQQDRPWERTISIAVQSAEALTFAHRQGIIHRDLKPANIVVDQSGVVKIVDFGLCAFAIDGAISGEIGKLTAAGMMVGTPHYASPEVCLGQPATTASDVYSLGCTLFELITGERPFEGKSLENILRRQVYETLSVRQTSTYKDGSVSERKFLDVVAACLRKDPRQRPSASDLVVAFRCLQNNSLKLPPWAKGDGKVRFPVLIASSLTVTTVAGALWFFLMSYKFSTPENASVALHTEIETPYSEQEAIKSLEFMKGKTALKKLDEIAASALKKEHFDSFAIAISAIADRDQPDEQPSSKDPLWWNRVGRPNQSKRLGLLLYALSKIPDNDVRWDEARAMLNLRAANYFVNLQCYDQCLTQLKEGNSRLARLTQSQRESYAFNIDETFTQLAGITRYSSYYSGKPFPCLVSMTTFITDKEYSWRLHRAIGNAQMNLGKPCEALVEYRLALDLIPNNPNVSWVKVRRKSDISMLSKLEQNAQRLCSSH